MRLEGVPWRGHRITQRQHSSSSCDADREDHPKCNKEPLAPAEIRGERNQGAAGSRHFQFLQPSPSASARNACFSQPPLPHRLLQLNFLLQKLQELFTSNCIRTLSIPNHNSFWFCCLLVSLWAHLCCSTGVEAREKLVRISSLLPRVLQGLNAVCKACQQVPFPADPSRQPIHSWFTGLFPEQRCRFRLSPTRQSTNMATLVIWT